VNPCCSRAHANPNSILGTVPVFTHNSDFFNATFGHPIWPYPCVALHHFVYSYGRNVYNSIVDEELEFVAK
jgi:hypothetical protein